MASNTTFQKRQKERARLDKQRDKTEEKKLRREQPNARVTSEPGVDPDIAGIIPGPQPIPDEFLLMLELPHVTRGARATAE